jgi:hypothetical protein
MDPGFRKLYWYGTGNTDNFDPVALLFFDLLKYCIWKAKVRKKIPRYQETTELLTAMVDTIAKCSKKIRVAITNNNLFSNMLQAPG